LFAVGQTQRGGKARLRRGRWVAPRMPRCRSNAGTSAIPMSAATRATSAELSATTCLMRGTKPAASQGCRMTVYMLAGGLLLGIKLSSHRSARSRSRWTAAGWRLAGHQGPITLSVTIRRRPGPAAAALHSDTRADRNAGRLRVRALRDRRSQSPGLRSANYVGTVSPLPTHLRSLNGPASAQRMRQRLAAQLRRCCRSRCIGTDCH
jgi:hypothetical protein